MRRNHFGWLLFVGSAALGVSACADGEPIDRDGGKAGSGGSSGSSGSSGAASAGKSSGGSKPVTPEGGTTAVGGEPTTDAGGEAGQGGSVAPGGSAGAGGAPESDGCVAPIALEILGDYQEPNGDDLWLRDSGRAVTLARVPAGKPVVGKGPSLWQVVESCPTASMVVLKNESGAFLRLDYVRGNGSLTACFSASTTTSAELARALPAAGRSNTIDAGCNGAPWLRVTKGGN